MNFTLRVDQQGAVDDAVAFLSQGKKDGKSSRLYKSPTGSGKSFIVVTIHDTMNKDYGLHYTVVPSHEIACGLGEKLGVPADRPYLEELGIWTVKRLYSKLQTGSVPLPDTLTFDESHHSVDNTHTTLWALCGFCPRVGVTATDYRGTPAETGKLRTAWGETVEVLSLRDAVSRNIVARPNFITWPLLDDHTIDVVNGEFVVKQVDNAVKDRLQDLVQRVARFWDGIGRYDRPTMVTFSGVAQCRTALSAFRDAGLPAVAVVGVSGPDLESDRARAFRRVVAREVLLLQVAVVGEGIDLPIRRLIDVAPTMSPMKWMQRTGRATRPVGNCSNCGGKGYYSPDDGWNAQDKCKPCGGSGKEFPPEVISCCHNFTRHSYLWHGVVPPSMVVANQKAWGADFKITRRDMARAIGLEGFGRFVVNHVPLADGGIGSLYVLQTPDGMSRYAVYLSPGDPTPQFFEQLFEYTGETDSFRTGGHTIEYKVKTKPQWRAIGSLPDLQDCVSVKADRVTAPMSNWWAKAAHRYGLDGTYKPDAREFQILPILANTGAQA